MSPEMIFYPSVQARYFDSPVSINLKLNDQTPDMRAGAVRELVARIDDNTQLEFSGSFDEARIRVTVEITEKTWYLDYHLVWPEPTAASPQLNSIRLINFAASGGPSPDTGSTARQLANDRLNQLINQLIGPGGALEGRIERLAL